MAGGGTVRQWVVERCIDLLTQPLQTYELRVPNNLDNLRRVLRKGDVLLVEGEQRMSQVIRYLTQSSWSHAALYVGDELLKPPYGQAARATEQFGEGARHLLLEALVGEGVIAAPLEKYEKFNIRICRPQGLLAADVQRVVAEVIGHLGDGYDVRHVYDLARYFFPISVVPRRWRRQALHFGHGIDREVICSSMIARAFAHVGYPILPRVTLDPAASRPAPPWWRRRLSRRGNHTAARFRELDPALITPRDFDLSPYFEIVKFNHLGDPNFSYRDIVWENPAAGAAEAGGDLAPRPTTGTASASPDDGGLAAATPAPLGEAPAGAGLGWILARGLLPGRRPAGTSSDS